MLRISETAYLVAMYRALETQRSNGLINDPLAGNLAGGQGLLHAQVIGNPEQGTTALAIRTRMMDELIEHLVQTRGVDTVLNLAAGLDTRPYRLSLPATLQWIEVDLPEILSYKAEKLQDSQPTCGVERVKLDLTDIPSRQALLADINARTAQGLVITEGLLLYLSEPQVGALAADLNQQPNFYWWMTELMSPFMVNQAKQHPSHAMFNQYFANGQEAFQFAPDAGVHFFEPYGWRSAEFRSSWKAARQYNRTVRFAGVWEFLLRCFARKIWQALSTQDGVVVLRRI
jgi:methyltransferase (TIGR00027 family)